MNRITEFRTTREWHVDLHGRNYRVQKTISDQHWDPTVRKTCLGETWTVWGGSWSRERRCDEDKPTHKRVVAWIKSLDL